MQKMASEVSKFINIQSPEYIHDLVSIKDSNDNFRSERIAEVPRVKTMRYGISHFCLKPSMYGIVSQMESDLQNLILSSRD